MVVKTMLNVSTIATADAASWSKIAVCFIDNNTNPVNAFKNLKNNLFKWWISNASSFSKKLALGDASASDAKNLFTRCQTGLMHIFVNFCSKIVGMTMSNGSNDNTKTLPKSYLLLIFRQNIFSIYFRQNMLFFFLSVYILDLSHDNDRERSTSLFAD